MFSASQINSSVGPSVVGPMSIEEVKMNLEIRMRESKFKFQATNYLYLYTLDQNQHGEIGYY